MSFSLFSDVLNLGFLNLGITTVMGAVMNGDVPMLVMEHMENGSL